MKLFYHQGACSLASHIMLYEVCADFDIEAVNTQSDLTASGQNYRDINPNGYVPALEIEKDVYLSESASVLQYIADTHSDSTFSPALGTIARARIQEFLNYAAAELHKSWSPLFSDVSTQSEKDAAEKKVKTKFDYLESVFSDGRQYLVGEQFSVADAYIFVLLYWTNFKNIDLKAWPKLASFVERIMARPSTQAAMKAEGLS